MSTLGMQVPNQDQGENTAPSRTLDFRQAMKDFRIMFPTLDAELIECVLRSNSGHVDSTIDQLLQLSQETHKTRRPWNTSNSRRFNLEDDSTDSDESIPSELLDPPTSSDDDLPIRDPPPQYTPHADDTMPNFFGLAHPVEVPVDDKKRGWHKDGKNSKVDAKTPRKPYRAWNPPFLGQLPDDFLRVLPQQFLTPVSRDKSRSQKPSSASKRRPSAASPSQGNNDTVVNSRSVLSGNTNLAQVERTTPPPGLSGPVLDSNLSNNLNNREETLTPPPRPPRTIPPSNRRLPQYNERDRNMVFRHDNIEQGNLFIRPATENRSFHHQHHHSMDATSQMQRNHYRSSRSSHGNRCHNSQQQQQLHHHQSVTPASTNCNHTRRSSDFSSRRMVMVSRMSEPAMPISHNDSTTNDLHLPITDRPPLYHRSSSQRSSSNSSNHQSSVFHRTELPCFAPQPRSSSRPASASARSRPRTTREEEQYVEDYHLAILLQNEEFIRELRRNDEFWKALQKDRYANNLPVNKPAESPSEKDAVPLPDPDGKYPHGSRNATPLKREGTEDLEKDDRAFKESLKHMGKSARKKFNEIAKKFSGRRKSSYKSMKNIDPVFANCDDDFDEEYGPRSPSFDL